MHRPWMAVTRSVIGLRCTGLLEQRARCLELCAIAQDQYAVARLELFVRAGVDDARPVTLNADDAGARRRPQTKLANQFAGGSRCGGDAHSVEIGVAQD